MFKNLKVRSKLFFSYCIILIFYIIAIIASSIGLGSVFTGLENFYNVPYPMVGAARETLAITRQIQLDVFRAASSAGDPAALQNIMAEIDKASATMSDAFTELEDSFEGDSSLLQSVQTAHEQTKTKRAEALEYISNGDLQGAIEIINGEYAEAANNLDTVLQEVIDTSQKTADEYYTSGQKTKQICTIILYSLGIVSVILTIILAIRNIKAITHPIAEIEDAVKAMAKGDMHSKVTYQSKDELGVLAENLRFVLKTLSEYISHICSRMDSLATGDLTVEMDMEYLGDFASIRHSGNKIIASLNDTLGQLHEASSQVASGSDQVSSGAQALSQGATEQASSVQELVATLNELSNQVNQTAKNSRDVNDLIAATGAEVNNSNNKMSAMMNAMTKINSSSSEIEKIIKTIEDISFQTNILALNAAVEAARAGEAGKGFAVVADEVRSLASKSAAAAKDTTELIKNSLVAVSEGNQLAEETQSSLIKVVESAQQIESNMQKITEASDMQAEGIQQVTLGIDQISSVIQTNSATAEQSAAASEELFSQSNLLNNLVERFHLKGSSTPMASTIDPIPASTSTPEPAPVSTPDPEPYIPVSAEFTSEPAPVYNDYEPVSAPAPKPAASHKAPASYSKFTNNMDKY